MRPLVVPGFALALAACGGGGGGGGDAGGGPAPDGAPARTLTAPARVTIDCPGEIPVDGKLDCTGVIAWPEGDEAYAGGIGVGLHGRSSLSFPKRQYAIELRHPDGSDDAVDLFGMGREADWLLNGAYLDRSLVRTKLGFDLFRAIGGAAPEARYAELTLDGEALGVFTLSERIERDPARIAIPDDAGSGASFIVRASESGIESALHGKRWEVVYPEPAPAGVATALADAEAAILAETPAMFDHLDLDGWVDFVLFEEAIKNLDAYFLSYNLYRGGADQPLRFAVWDLDLSLGQASYNDNERPDLWIQYRTDLVERPVAQAVAKQRLVERWAELRGGVLATDAVLARLDAERALLGDAIERNWAIWDIAEVGAEGFPLYPVASPAEEYAAIEAFVAARLAWIDAHIDEL